MSSYFRDITAKKAIVFLPELLKLFQICREPNCGSFVDEANINMKTVGAWIRVEYCCNNHHFGTWDNSPLIGSGKEAVSVLNILIACYCLTCGLHIQQILEFFQHLRLISFGKSFFFNLQDRVLEKVVWLQWLFAQKSSLNKVKEYQEQGGQIHLAGDGTYDSRGFSAAYCTYVVQDLKTKEIIGMYIAHKYQTKSSSNMEPFAAKSLILNLVKEHHLPITSVTTDRSSTVKAALSEIADELPEGCEPIEHNYDPWHYIRTIMKDLWDASKLKSCSDLGPWLDSINNMLWHSFGQCKGNLKLLEEMILSIPEHISNNHKFPHNTVLKACSHGNLSAKDREKAWLHPDSLSVKKVRQAIMGHDRSRFNDLQYMLRFTHTGQIESWNALHNKYANKNYFYRPSGMFIRAALTALDWNANIGRMQAQNASGQFRYQLVSNRAGSKW